MSTVGENASIGSQARSAGAAAPVLALSDPLAADPDIAGAKAANLALAASRGFPVVPGCVVTTAAFAPDDPGWDAGLPPAVADAVVAATQRIGAGEGPLVVRSSSTVEDIGASSMAGQFLSVLDVRGQQDLLDAVRRVQRSALRVAREGAPAPMAVVIQRQLQASVGGVMFGLDPVTGDRRHILVEAVPGGPEQLVSGTVTAQRFLLGRRGRVVEGPPEQDGAPLLDRRLRRRLVRLSQRARESFGCEQDIEWALDTQDRLWLLQARPVTAVGAAHAAGGLLLGPGPVGETFPRPLRPLEQDLWLVPLARGIESALTVIAAVPARRIAQSPVVTTVGGRVACDLQLLGAAPQRPGIGRLLNPVVGLRKLVSAWRVGRLRAVLPGLALQMCRRVDAELAALPSLSELSDPELLELMQRTRCYLMSVHGHEVLAGTLLRGGSGASAAGAAMAVLQRGRCLGLSDAEITERWPVALALTAPAVGQPPDLPPTSGDSPEVALPIVSQLDQLPPREALRLRARWLQELSAAAAAVLAVRLAEQARIPSADLLPMLRLAELSDIVAGWPAPPDLPQRRSEPGPPLPSAFRLDADGAPVRVRVAGAHRAGGRGASQGRAEGAVVQDVSLAGPGDILVTRTLDPTLAPWLPGLGGIVSETGSVLSHLAILAREYKVPAVVAVHDAVDRYPAGARLLVDGSTGEVRMTAPAPPAGGAS